MPVSSWKRTITLLHPGRSKYYEVWEDELHHCRLKKMDLPGHEDQGKCPWGIYVADNLLSTTFSLREGVRRLTVQMGQPVVLDRSRHWEGKPPRHTLVRNSYPSNLRLVALCRRTAAGAGDWLLVSLAIEKPLCRFRTVPLDGQGQTLPRLILTAQQEDELVAIHGLPRSSDRPKLPQLLHCLRHSAIGLTRLALDPEDLAAGGA
jgi:hypothetical protein